MAQQRSEHTATLLGNGTVLVTGGWSALGPHDASALFDPRTETFGPAGAMNVTRSGQLAIALDADTVLVAGGHGGLAGPLASAERYDLASDTWSSTTSMSHAGSEPLAARLTDGRILVHGAFDVGDARANVYDPSNHAWSVTGR